MEHSPRVPGVYVSSALPALLAELPFRRIDKLRASKTLFGFDYHSRLHFNRRRRSWLARALFVALFLAALTVPALKGRPHPPQTATPEQPAEEHYRRGLAALQTHDLPKAIREFRLTLKYTPKSPPVHNSLGEAYLEKGQVDAAAIEFRKAIALSPQFVEAYFNMGRALERRQDLGGAITFFRWALKFRPDWAEVHAALGSVLRQNGDLDGALAELREALRFDPQDAKAHQALGMVLRQKGDLTGAAAEFRQAELLDKEKPNIEAATAATDAGEKQLREGNVEAAIERFQAALELAPNYAPAHYQMGMALRKKGDLDLAAAEFEKAHQLDPHLAPPRD